MSWQSSRRHCPREWEGLAVNIVNLPQHSVMLIQCDVDLVCVSIELLSTYFNLPQPSVMLVQCVPIELLST